MDDQWCVLQSEGEMARSSTPHPMHRLASGPKRVPNLLGALLSVRARLAVSVFQLGAQQSHHPRSRFGLRKQRSIGLGGS